jgi:hypothetical protein
MLRIAESPIATANAECREAELALPVAGAPPAAGVRTFRPRLAAEFAADRPIYLLAALYLLLAEFLALTLPGHPPVLPLLYLPLWLRAAFGLLLGFVLLRTVPETLRARPDSPLRLLLSRAATYVTPRAVAGVCLILLQAVLMGTFTSVKNMLPELSRYVWDTDLANIDRYVMGGHDGWSYVTPLLARTGLLPALEFFYVTGWMMALGLVPALVALLPSMAPLRLRFFLTYILCWAMLGNIVALAGMSAGPAYFGEVTGDYDRHRALLDLLAANSGATWSAYDIQRALWQAYAHGMSSLGSGISAFPSLHVAMAVLWTIVGFRRGRAAGLAGLAFLTLVFLGSVALGWHYVLDGVAAAIMVPLIWWSVGYVLDRAGPAAKVARAW